MKQVFELVKGDVVKSPSGKKEIVESISVDKEDKRLVHIKTQSGKEYDAPAGSYVV